MHNPKKGIKVAMIFHSRTKAISSFIVFVMCTCLVTPISQSRLSNISWKVGETRKLSENKLRPTNETETGKDNTVLVINSTEYATNESTLNLIGKQENSTSSKVNGTNSTINIAANASTVEKFGLCEEYCYVINVPWIYEDHDLNNFHKCDWKSSCSGCPECFARKQKLSFDGTHDYSTSNALKRTSSYGSGKINLNIIQKIVIFIIILIPPSILLVERMRRYFHYLKLKRRFIKDSSGNLEIA